MCCVRMFDPLERYLEVRVLVLMTSGSVISGVLKGFDRHLNLNLSRGEIQEDGLKTVIGDLIIRGASILAVAEAKIL